MEAGHPLLTEKKENKDEIQVRSHPETSVACELRPPQRGAAIFGVTEDSPNEVTFLKFHSCQHLKESSPLAQRS